MGQGLRTHETNLLRGDSSHFQAEKIRDNLIRLGVSTGESHLPYPAGTPTDQGETVRLPSSGTEKHYLVARVHNAGTIRAKDVKVRWLVCDPSGSGDDGRWVEKNTQKIPEVGPGDF